MLLLLGNSPLSKWWKHTFREWNLFQLFFFWIGGKRGEKKEEEDEQHTRTRASIVLRASSKVKKRNTRRFLSYSQVLKNSSSSTSERISNNADATHWGSAVLNTYWMQARIINLFRIKNLAGICVPSANVKDTNEGLHQCSRADTTAPRRIRHSSSRFSTAALARSRLDIVNANWLRLLPRAIAIDGGSSSANVNLTLSNKRSHFETMAHLQSRQEQEQEQSNEIVFLFLFLLFWRHPLFSFSRSIRLASHTQRDESKEGSIQMQLQRREEYIPPCLPACLQQLRRCWLLSSPFSLGSYY